MSPDMILGGVKGGSMFSSFRFLAVAEKKLFPSCSHVLDSDNHGEAHGELLHMKLSSRMPAFCVSEHRFSSLSHLRPALPNRLRSY